MSFVKDIVSTIKTLSQSGFTLGGGAPASPTNAVAGDIEIISLTLMSEDQQRAMDLINHCKFINIYESVFSPTIFADLSIADGINLIQSFPINGEELIKIEFKTPGRSTSSQYLLKVNAVVNKQVINNNKIVTYTLQCVSPEMFINSSKLISKQLNDTISAGVKDILQQELSTQKPIKIEDTRGVDKSLITRMSPFKAIDYVRRRAVSKKYASSSYVFFENKNGFNFTTLEKLIDDGSKSVDSSDNVFFFDNISNNTDTTTVTIRNILAYDQLSFADSLSKVKNGGVTNKVSRFDLITGDTKVLNYTNNESQDRFKTIDKNAIATSTSGFDARYGKTAPVTKLVPFSSDRNESLVAEKTSILQAFTQRLVQNIVQIFVYGDSQLTVGDVIACNFPEVSSMTNDKSTAALDGGNYLITKVRHIITIDARPSHHMSMELVKGSFTDN